MANAWMVRAGRDGEREEEALSQSLIIAGWPEMGDLTRFTTRGELRAAVVASYPHRSPTVAANWTGQLWRLAHDMQLNDFVVVPLKTVQDHVAIGRVCGDYTYRQDAEADRRHVRPVEWLQRALPRSVIQQDLLYSLGSLLTICQLRRHGAARRIAALAQTGVDPGPTQDELQGSEWVTPDAFLAEARAAEDGVVLSVRDLLAQWGAGRRTSAAVSAIQHDLAENGLVTVPPFSQGWIGDRITVVKSGAEADDVTDETPAERRLTTQAGQPTAVTDDDPLAEDKPFRLLFGNLTRADNPAVSVRPTDTVVRAQTLMLRHKYSQLAVVEEDGTFRGAISWETIAKAAMAQTAAAVVEQALQVVAAVEHAEAVLPRLDEIIDRGFVFVRSPDGKTISGIVTSADLAGRFGEIARPFSMIEECERRLRRRVEACIPDAVIAKTTRHKTADTLTLGSYPRVLKEQKHYDLLGWALDHEQFVAQVTDVAKVRNRMMHFSPDPLSTDDWDAIEGLLAMLQVVDPLP